MQYVGWDRRRSDRETGRGATKRLHDFTTARRHNTRIPKFGVIVKVLFWGVVIRTALFAVAAADIIGEVFAGFGIDIPGELPFCSAGWAGVAG